MDSSPTIPMNQTSVNESGEEEEEQLFSYAMQLVTAASLPMVLLSTIRLDVFEIIAKAGQDAQLSPYQIAARMHSKNPDAPSMLDRMLRLLASYSILTCSVAGEGHLPLPRVYGLAPVAKYFVRNSESEGASLGGLLGLLQDKVFIDSWSVKYNMSKRMVNFNIYSKLKSINFFFIVKNNLCLF